MRWESDGEGDYTRRDDRRKPARGTDVILHLRDGRGRAAVAAGSCAPILRKYSDHITLPILMKKEQWDADAQAQVVTDEDETGQPGVGAVGAAEVGDHRRAVPRVLQARRARLRAAARLHAQPGSRAGSEYTQLLYIPAARAVRPVGPRARARGIKLYVRRVFIMDDAEQLMPAYLRFVRGVIDSNDLPLNVSREILQQSRDVEAIRAGSIKRVLGLLEDLADATSRRSTRRSGRSSAACSRKASARTSATASASPSCCASRRRTTTRDDADRLARRLRRRA